MVRELVGVHLECIGDDISLTRSGYVRAQTMQDNALGGGRLVIAKDIVSEITIACKQRKSTLDCTGKHG